MSNRNEKINEALKKTRSAGSKISRIKRNTGAKISGSEFDPRVSPSQIRSMNGRQLNSYINRVNKFNDRKTQFVGLGRGVPVPRNEWNTYKANEARERILGEQHKSTIGDLYVEDYGSTVQQLLDMRPQKTRVKVEKAVYGPYSDIEREPTEIPSRSALNTFIANQEKKFKPGYFRSKIKEGRENLTKALIAMGNDVWLEQVNRLTEYQFDALWFGNPAAIEAVFLSYGDMKDRAASEERSSKERWQDKVINDESAEFGRFLDWAENEVPRNRPSNGATNSAGTGKKTAKPTRPR